MKKKSEIHASVVTKVMPTVYDKSLAKMEKALNLCVADMNRNCALIDGNMLPRKY